MLDNSDIPITSNKQPFSSLSQNSSENAELSLGPFENSQDKKKIKIVPNAGSSASELRSSLKHALQILDRMQTDKENEIDDNFNRNLNLLNSNQDNSNLSKSEQLSKPKNYKIIRKKKFVPYRRSNEDPKAENSQDRTEVSLFLGTPEKIKNNDKSTNRPSNLNFENLQITARDVDLLSDSDQNNVDLDELAKSLGFHLEVSDQDEEGDEDTKLVDVSDFISNDSQGNSLSLGDKMKMLGHLITVAEGDLDDLSKIENEVDNT